MVYMESNGVMGAAVRVRGTTTKPPYSNQPQPIVIARPQRLFGQTQQQADQLWSSRDWTAPGVVRRPCTMPRKGLQRELGGLANNPTESLCTVFSLELENAVAEHTAALAALQASL